MGREIRTFETVEGVTEVNPSLSQTSKAPCDPCRTRWFPTSGRDPVPQNQAHARACSWRPRRAFSWVFRPAPNAAITFACRCDAAHGVGCDTQPVWPHRYAV